MSMPLSGGCSAADAMKARTSRTNAQPSVATLSGQSSKIVLASLLNTWRRVVRVGLLDLLDHHQQQQIARPSAAPIMREHVRLCRLKRRARERVGAEWLDRVGGPALCFALKPEIAEAPRRCALAQRNPADADILAPAQRRAVGDARHRKVVSRQPIARAQDVEQYLRRHRLRISLVERRRIVCDLARERVTARGHRRPRRAGRQRQRRKQYGQLPHPRLLARECPRTAQSGSSFSEQASGPLPLSLRCA